MIKRATEISDYDYKKYSAYIEKLNLRVVNVRKYRGRIERRKEKIKRIYE
jgi:hypothetical protein